MWSPSTGGLCSSLQELAPVHAAAAFCTGPWQSASWQAALVVAPFGGTVPSVVKACLRHQARQRDLPYAERSGVRRPCGGGARTAGARDKGGSPPASRVSGSQLCNEGNGSVPQGPLSGETGPRVQARRVGRECKVARACLCGGAFEACVGLADGTARPCAAWSPDPTGFGLSGSEGTTLVSQGLSLRGRVESLAPGSVHWRTPSAGSGLRRLSALCQLASDGSSPAKEGACFLSTRVVSRSARPSEELGSCARSTWLWPDVGLVLAEGQAARSGGWLGLAPVGRQLRAGLSPLSVYRFD